MPLTKYSGANLKKLKKDELRCHIVELYGFIDIFSNENLLKKKDEEIEKLKFHNEEKDGIIFNIGDELKEYIDDYPTHKEGEIYDAIKKLKEENKEVKKEMKTMYHIIMNDGEKYELSDKQPLIKMVQFNIGLMLEKFKEMGALIIENAVKVIKWDALIKAIKDTSENPDDFDIWEFLGDELGVSTEGDEE